MRWSGWEFAGFRFYGSGGVVSIFSLGGLDFRNSRFLVLKVVLNHLVKV